ncbi:SUN domain-containing protein 2-like [Trichosurus vulpecula]|uniref:SUN domain-containing protein 2-like n=1 Tax=Trichosurus vulpecula TaxID=9337 RepID=UPI00186AFBDC|nr:SUN domain-containing protein 2-like [Trichosurus vulpecula]
MRRKTRKVKFLSSAHPLHTASNQCTTYKESVVREASVSGPWATWVTRSSLLVEELYYSNSSWSENAEWSNSRTVCGDELLMEGSPNTVREPWEDPRTEEQEAAAELAGWDQANSGPGWAWRAKTLKPTAGTFTGWLSGLLSWLLGTSCYYLTTAASLMDIIVFNRCCSTAKKMLLFLLLPLLLVSLTFGAWYFYLYGLQTFHPAMLSWWAAKGSSKSEELQESGKSTPNFQAEQHVLSRVHCSGRRLETLTSDSSAHWQKEAARLEHLQLQAGAIENGDGKCLSQEDILTVLEGLVSRLEAILKEDFRRESTAYIQEAMAKLRAKNPQDLDNILKKITWICQELETWMLQLKLEWQSLAQEAVQENIVKEMGPLQAQLAGMRQELVALSQRQAAVAEQKHLWQEKMAALRSDVESHFSAWINQFLVGDKSTQSGFLQVEEVQAQLRDLEQRILTQVAEGQVKFASKAAASLRLSLLKEGLRGMTEEEVRQMVKQALQLYSEDRIGLVDYALESSGASIISSHCSATYDTRIAVLSLFGIPLWYYAPSPRAILQPDVYPGNCWAFRGPQGFVGIRLSASIHLTAVTLEHVPKALSPISNIPSAPKDFVVLGLNENSQSEGVALGHFTYDNAGESIQTFHIQDNDTRPYRLVELRILSNWGHPEYTCVYRFRVHGQPAN